MAKVRNMKVQMLAECGIMLALSIVLSVIKIWEMPMGGSITLCSMLPVVLLGIKYGPKIGVTVGFLNGIVQLIMGIASGNVFVYCTTAFTTIMCALFDYIVPFSCIGLSGIFKKVSIGKFKTFGIYLGIVFAIFLRFCCHYMTGVLIWGQWAGDEGPYIYSLLYNGTYLLPELIITVVVAAILIGIPQIRKLIGIKIQPENATQVVDEATETAEAE